MTLPPLPKPHLLVFDAALQSPIDGWTRSQVEAYARVAVEAAIAAPPTAAGWIACAERMPPSGQKVLACYRNRADMHRTIMARWIAAKSREGYEEHSDLDLVYDDAADCYYWPEGWYETMDNWPEYSNLVVSEGEVTHWQPLPAPPAKDE